MRRLLTGATGFIGSHLARRLAAEEGELHVVVRGSSAPTARPRLPLTAKIHLYDGSTESMVALVGETRPDVVFHLASLAVSEHTTAQLRPLIDSNVLFPTQLLEAMTLVGARRFINMGSAWQHFEGRPYSPTGLYAGTKQAFEVIARFYAEARGLEAMTLKLFHAYGPRDPRARVVTQLVRAARTGAHLPMTPGEQFVDLVYIDDVIEALLAAERRLVASEASGCQSFAIATEKPLRIRELADLVERVTDRPLDIGWGELPYKERAVMTRFSLGELIPDWAPRVSLEEGIRRLWKAESAEQG
jgi:nucleoside-diphosphate-sugar epimerase